MIRRQQRIQRMNEVAQEFRVATSAMRLVITELHANPSWGDREGWQNRDVRNFEANLEATYVIRLYAEFESGLRELWRDFYGRASHPRMKVLLSNIGAARHIPQDWVDDADAVRRYRNSLVHEDVGEDYSIVPVFDAKAGLCRYFSRLPEDW